MVKLFNKKNIKKTYNENKEFFNTVFIIAVAATGMVIGHKIDSSLNKRVISSEKGINKIPYNEILDLGRDCIATFTVEETGEVLGKVPITENAVYELMDW